MKDYFKELYETKKKLLNELEVMAKIKEALSFSNIYTDEIIQELKEDLKAMEVDLKE